MASERSHEVDKQVPVISCLDDLIHQLRDVFQTDCVNVDYVRSLLSAYKSNSKDWKKYAVFDPHRYDTTTTSHDDNETRSKHSLRKESNYYGVVSCAIK